MKLPTIKKNSEFLKFINESRKFYFKEIDLATAPGEKKFAIVVKKKLFPKASQRNRIKRRIREAIRILWPSLKEYKFAILVKEDLSKTPFSQLKQILIDYFKKAGLWKN